MCLGLISLLTPKTKSKNQHNLYHYTILSLGQRTGTEAGCTVSVCPSFAAIMEDS